MNSSAPQIKRLNLRKASAEIRLAISVNGRSDEIRNDINIRYQVVKGENGAADSLRISLICDVHTDETADPDASGRFKANVGIIYEVILQGEYDHKYLDDIMHSVWPYLRSAAVHQLQLLDIPEISATLPFNIGPNADEVDQ